MIVQLRRWPLRRDIAKRLAPAVRCVVESKEPVPRLRVVEELGAIDSHVSGWYWKAGMWLTGSMTYCVILDDERLILQIGRRAMFIDQRVHASWKFGFLRHHFAAKSSAGDILSCSYLRAHEFLYPWLDALDPGIIEFVEYTDPLCWVANLVESRKGFLHWLTSLQELTGLYADPLDQSGVK